MTVWAPGQCPAPGLGGEAKLVEGGGEPFNHDTDYNRWLIVLHTFVSRYIMYLHARDVHFSLPRLAGCAGHGPGSWLLGAAAAGLEQLGSPHLGELVIVMMMMMMTMMMMMMMMAGALSGGGRGGQHQGGAGGQDAGEAVPGGEGQHRPLR